jgi:murein DD-endopeptidase MepM/ murein hydrolase activator NlpD
VVALGAAAAFPDNSADPATLSASASGAASTTDLADRQSTLDRATRGDGRTVDASTVDSIGSDLWLLPVQNYTIASPYGSHWGTAQPGVDLSVSEATPYVAAHAGTVVLARFAGGYGYAIEIDCGDGTTLVYGHSSALLVQEGQKVEAGQVIGLTGNTGYSTSPQLHFEVLQNGNPVNPLPFLLAKGVDIANKTQAIDS